MGTLIELKPGNSPDGPLEKDKRDWFYEVAFPNKDYADWYLQNTTLRKLVSLASACGKTEEADIMEFDGEALGVVETEPIDLKKGVKHQTHTKSSVKSMMVKVGFIELFKKRVKEEQNSKQSLVESAQSRSEHYIYSITSYSHTGYSVNELPQFLKETDFHTMHSIEKKNEMVDYAEINCRDSEGQASEFCEQVRTSRLDGRITMEVKAFPDRGEEGQRCCFETSSYKECYDKLKNTVLSDCLKYAEKQESKTRQYTIEIEKDKDQYNITQYKYTV